MSFTMKYLGPTKQFFCMKIISDRNAKKLQLSQEKYIEKVLQRFNMDKAKTVHCLLANHFKLNSKQCSSIDKETKEIENILYASGLKV